MLLTLAMGACGDDDNEDVDIIIDEGQANGFALAAMADTELGPQTVAISEAMAGHILITVDQGEIQQADVALDRLDESETIRYANHMIEDHQPHIDLVLSVLDQDRLDPIDNEVSAMLRANAEAGVRDIQASGDPDVTYMQWQIRMHEAASIVTERLLEHVEDPEMDALLLQTLDIIDGHRQEAIALYRDL